MLRHVILFACFTALAVAVAAEEPAEAPKIDPLTGQPIQVEEAAPPEEPAGPDLSTVNELVLEGSYEEAESELVKVLAEYPDNADVLLLQGEVLVAQRKLEPAVEVLEKCASIDANRPRLHFQLGSALAQMGQNERAVEEFAKELELNDDKKVLLLTHLNRTAVFGTMENWEGASGELEAVIALDPSQVQAYGDLVSFYLQAGKLDEAADALQRGADAGFTSAPHYYSLGARLYRAERLEESTAAFAKTLEVDPNFARAERSLGNVYEKLGQNEAAVQHFKRYLELAPDAPDAKRIAELIEETENS